MNEVERSSRPEIRNPVLKLASAKALRDLPPEAKEALRLVLVDLRADAQVNADKCWKKHKAPMAAYWKCVSVYVGHTARILRPSGSAR
jgi:hypothetical protein